MGTTSQKLTYLNDTKTKIRDGINAIGGSLDSDDTFRSYADELESLYDEMPKVSESDVESASLTPTRKGAMSIKYKGNTQQDSTTGKNLLPLNIISSQTSGSLTITNLGDGTLKLNGTNSNQYIDISYNYELQANVEYKWVNLNALSGSDGNVSFRDNSNNSITYTGLANASNTYTPTSNKQVAKMRLFFGTTTFNNYIVKIMFIKSTDTETWEKYTGGSPAPSPSYPFDIHNVSGDNTIEIVGKNLFDYNKITTSANYTNNYDGSFTRNSNGTNILINVDNASVPYDTFSLKAGAYSVSFDILTTAAVTLSNFFMCTRQSGTSTNLSKSIGVQIPANTITHIKAENYVVVNNAEKVGFAGYLSASTGVVISNIQVEKNNQATAYEAYTGNSQLISLGVENEYKASKTIQGPYNANQGLISTRITWFGKQVASGDTMTITCNNDDLRFGTGRTSMNECNASNVLSQYSDWQTGTYTITFNSNGYAFMVVSKNDNTTISTSDLTDTDFIITFNGNRYSSTPIELCKISTYQDYIYKDNDRWFLHKEIGKIVLNGSENWQQLADSTWGANGYYIAKPTDAMNWGRLIATYFKDANISSPRILVNGEMSITASSLVLRNDNTTDGSALKTWLSTHNTIVNYVLATPTDTEITDTTLLEQLETIKRSYDGVTNISQENNDLPFILDVSALKEWE